MARRPRTLLEVCTRKRGQFKGAITAAHFAQYAIAMNDLEKFPTAVEYADYWAISERTAFAHRAGMHDVYGDRWPEVVEQLADEIARRQTRSLGEIGRFALTA